MQHLTHQTQLFLQQAENTRLSQQLEEATRLRTRTEESSARTLEALRGAHEAALATLRTELQQAQERALQDLAEDSHARLENMAAAGRAEVETLRREWMARMEEKEQAHQDQLQAALRDSSSGLPGYFRLKKRKKKEKKICFVYGAELNCAVSATTMQSALEAHAKLVRAQAEDEEEQRRIKLVAEHEQVGLEFK